MMETVSTNEDFIKVYDQYADAIFRHCFFKLSNRELAKDVAQDVFMKTWEYIVSNNDEIRNMKSFLYRVTNNLIIDQYRKNKHDLSLEMMMEDGIDFPSQKEKSHYFSSEVQIVLKNIKKLNPIYREVLLLRYIDDLTPCEIAEILNQSENVVSVRINRGIKKLQQFLNK